MFLGYFLAGAVVFLTLFVTVDAMSNFAREGAELSAVLRYYAYGAPAILYQMLPVACLLAVVFTLGTLSKTNELVALFASGMSLARVSLPILTMVALISAIGFFVNDRLVPPLNQLKKYVYFVEIKKQPGLYSTVKTDRIWYRSGRTLFNIKSLNSEKAEAEGLTLYEFDDDWNLAQLITAKRVQFQGDYWLLKMGMVTLFPEVIENDQGSSAKHERELSKQLGRQWTFESIVVPETAPFEEKKYPVASEISDLQKSSTSTDVLSIAELKRFIKKNRASGHETLSYEVDLQAKLSFGWAALVMSLIAIPFSVGKARSGSMAFGVGITVVLAFVYWAFYSSGLTLGRHGAVPPLLAAWGPNLSMALMALVLLIRLKR